MRTAGLRSSLSAAWGSSAAEWKVPTAGIDVPISAAWVGPGTAGSWRWTTSGSKDRRASNVRLAAALLGAMGDIEPLLGTWTLRPTLVTNRSGGGPSQGATTHASVPPPATPGPGPGPGPGPLPAPRASTGSRGTRARSPVWPLAPAGATGKAGDREGRRPGRTWTREQGGRSGGASGEAATTGPEDYRLGTAPPRPRPDHEGAPGRRHDDRPREHGPARPRRRVAGAIGRLAFRRPDQDRGRRRSGERRGGGRHGDGRPRIAGAPAHRARRPRPVPA